MPIKLAENFRAVFYAPFYAAQSLGFYTSEGVEVELVNSSNPGDGVSALLNDAVDISWGGPMRVMKPRDLKPSSPLVFSGGEEFTSRVSASRTDGTAICEGCRSSHAFDVPSARPA